MRMRVFAAWVCGIVFLCGVCGVQGAVQCGVLRCEYRVNPLGIDTARPRVRWTLESEGRNEVQSAYRVLVASTAEALAADEGDLWDSGKVSWSDNMNVGNRSRK
jgi:alpha-L-rhamnosidase